MWPSAVVRRPCEAQTPAAHALMRRRGADRGPHGALGPCPGRWHKQRGRACVAGPTPPGAGGRLVKRPPRKARSPGRRLIIAPRVYDRGISIDGPTPERGRLKARARPVRTRKRTAATTTGPTCAPRSTPSPPMDGDPGIAWRRVRGQRARRAGRLTGADDRGRPHCRSGCRCHCAQRHRSRACVASRATLEAGPWMAAASRQNQPMCRSGRPTRDETHACLLRS
jgi:hypothetical protein